MNPIWQALQRELHLWQQSGRYLHLWWRDDDTVAASRSLEQLITLSDTYQIPLALSVIPARAERDLGSFLEKHRRIVVIQHGLTHANLATPGYRKSEWSGRPLNAMLSELKQGRLILQQLFADQTLSVLVPPWNRIDNELITRLPQTGLVGLSGFQSLKQARRHFAQPSSTRDRHRLPVFDTHIDPIHWQSRQFSGETSVMMMLLEHLKMRRCSEVGDSSQTVGILTHHQVSDRQGWSWLEQLCEVTCQHPGVKWLNLRQIEWRL